MRSHSIHLIFMSKDIYHYVKGEEGQGLKMHLSVLTTPQPQPDSGKPDT